MIAENLRQQARSFHCKKRLGQNFLVNPDILTQIAEALQIQPYEKVLEIGPGLGFLTALLLGPGASVIAVELDSECVDILKSLSLPRLTVTQQDFLKYDLGQLLPEKFKVTGNIPYQITAPILTKLLGEIGQPATWLPSLDLIVLTVQREVAQRFVAKVGEKEYSQISLLVQYYADAELLFAITADNFFPEPEVTSAVVRLRPHHKPKVKCRDHTLLRQIVAAGFQQRRKMLKNNLSFLGLDQQSIMDVFARLNFDPQVRAERLSLEQFALLAGELSEVRETICQQLPP